MNVVLATRPVTIAPAHPRAAPASRPAAAPIGGRANGPGMHWTVAGARAIGMLRAAYPSRRWTGVERSARVR